MHLEKAYKEFELYVKDFDKNNPEIIRKIGHSKRVMEMSKKIAKNLKMNEDEIDIATIIGLLHDIGKIKQRNDGKNTNIEHGEYAVQILQQNNYIRNFIETSDYDEIIFKAIRNHGLYAISENLNSKELIFAKIIRDADKLDILYQGANLFWNNEQERKKVEDSFITQDVFETVKKNQLIFNSQRNTPLNDMIWFIDLVYDLNFEYSFLVLKKENYINKILDKFNFSDKIVKSEIEEIRDIINSYINNIIKNKVI